MERLEPLTLSDLVRLGLDVPAFSETTVPVARGNPKQKWHVPGRNVAGVSCSYLPAAARIEDVVLLEVLRSLCSSCVFRLDPAVRALWELCAEVIDVDRDVAVVDATAAKEDGTWLEYARIRQRAPHRRDHHVRALVASTAGVLPPGQARRVLEAWSAAGIRWSRAAERLRAVLPLPHLAACVTGVVDSVHAAGLAAAGYDLDRVYGNRSRAQLWPVASMAWARARVRGKTPEAAAKAAADAVSTRWSGYPILDVSALPPAVTSAEGHAGPASWARAEADHHAHALVADWCRELDERLARQDPDADGRVRLVLVNGWPLTKPQDAKLAFLSAWEQVGPRVPTKWLPDHDGYGQEDVRVRDAVVLAVPAAVAAVAAEIGNPRHCTVWRDTERGTRRQRIVLGPEVRPGLDPAGTAAAANALLRTVYPLLQDDLPAAFGEPSDAVAQARRDLAAHALPFPDTTATRPDDTLSLRIWPAVRPGLAWIPGTAHFDRLLDDSSKHGVRDAVLVAQSGPGEQGQLVLVEGRIRQHADGGSVTVEPFGRPAIRVPLQRVAALVSSWPDRPRSRSAEEIRVWAPYEGALHALTGCRPR